MIFTDILRQSHLVDLTECKSKNIPCTVRIRSNDSIGIKKIEKDFPDAELFYLPLGIVVIKISPEPDEPDDDNESQEEFEFQCCDDCDLPDACSDFGCAIKQGLRSPNVY